MTQAAYRAVLVALVQSLKSLTNRAVLVQSLNLKSLTNTRNIIVSDVLRCATALEIFLMATPPHDCYALRDQVRDLSRRITQDSDMTMGVAHELCRDMLGMLDVPYEER